MKMEFMWNVHGDWRRDKTRDRPCWTSWSEGPHDQQNTHMAHGTSRNVGTGDKDAWTILPLFLSRGTLESALTVITGLARHVARTHVIQSMPRGHDPIVAAKPYFDFLLFSKAYINAWFHRSMNYEVISFCIHVSSSYVYYQEIW